MDLKKVNTDKLLNGLTIGLSVINIVLSVGVIDNEVKELTK